LDQTPSDLSLTPPVSKLAPLAPRLRQLADQGIYLGTSSWRYEGWVGSVYTPERYFTRNKFSKKKWHEECLTEFSEIFPTMCGDFSFYSFPTEEEWQRVFAQAPSVKFAFKVPERLTVRTWPGGPRYGGRAGKPNDAFLDPQLFGRAFMSRLEPYKDHIGVIVIEFGAFSKQEYPDVGLFCEHLKPFLGQLPKDWHFAVETRNREFFEPVYFQTLKDHGVAHVMNSWTRSPDLSEQVANPDAVTADFYVARALLKPGRTFTQAVKLFEPYSEVKEPYEPAREAFRQIMRLARDQKKTAFLYAGNRLEGHSPGTIQAIAESSFAAASGSD
jgi:uncharacterized protein YecE (DUF72 family)